MFTGIVKAIGSVTALEKKEGFTRYAIQFPPTFLEGLERGASVSVDGVCLTVVSIDHPKVWFDAIPETIHRTTFKWKEIGGRVNLERAAKFGDEIGGHLLSGHIYGTTPLVSIEKNIYTFESPIDWMKYFFSKGYIAIDGISLTLVSVDQTTGRFTVHLIPETLERTTLSTKRVGEHVNIEIDAMTQAVVETSTRFLKPSS